MIGAGALLLAVLAVAVYLGVIKPGQEIDAQREHASEVMELAKALEQNVPLLLDRVKDLQPAPPASILDPAEQDLEDARRYQRDGQEDYEIESFGAAGKSFERSIRSYEETCLLLVTKFIATGADTRAARTRERVKGLEAVGAAEHVKEEWATLQTAMAGLAAPAGDASPCAAAGTHLDRIDTSAATTAMIARVESDLGEVWPRLAATARNEADAARKVAESERVDAIEVTRALEAGRQGYARAERSEQTRDYPAARDEYETARDEFNRAAKIAPSARARTDVRRIEEEVAAGGVRIGSRVSLLISRADEAYGRGDYAQAEQLYTEAISGMTGDMKRDELERVVGEVRTKALSTREVAVREGAERSAEVALARADETRDDGRSALSEGRYDEAESRFRTAQTEYAAARDSAIQSMASAREAEDQARRVLETLVRGGQCEKLESTTAQAECESASGELRAGSESIAALDAPSALTKLRTARESLDRAVSTEHEFIRTKPRPPELVKRTPQRERVEVYRSQSQRFIVEAKDDNPGDRLQYSWHFDGRPVQLSGSDVEFTPDSDGTIQVTVSDGRDSFTESWELVLKNRKPELSVDPKPASIALSVGQAKSFSATATDPDGERVDVTFVLDGRKVASGPSYRFNAAKAANHRLEIVASDASGAKTVITKQIRVSSTSVDRVPPTPAPTPAGPNDEPAWKVGVREALGEYESAIEAKDMARLQQVWMLNDESLYFRRWQAKFESSHDISVEIAIRSMENQGAQVMVEFDQTEQSRGKIRTWRYHSTLIERGGAWQIVENKLHSQ
jgi:tetratricopeptide (TPR) repeat protein